MANNKKNSNSHRNGANKRSTNTGFKPSPRDKEDRGAFLNKGGCVNYDKNTTNDISWWNKIATNFNLVTRIPYGKLASYPYKVPAYGRAWGDDDKTARRAFAIPSAMRITYTPGVGIAGTNEDACNIAFSNMYAAIASKTSTAVPFPKHLLATHIIAMQSIAQNIAMCKRALSVSNMWHSANVAFPQMMLKVLGFNPESVLEHRDIVAVKLNNIIRRFNSYPVPSYIDVFARHYSLASNIWADQDDVRAQFYAFVPSVWYLYSDLGDFGPGGFVEGINSAIAIKFDWADSGALLDIDDVFDIINKQLNAIANSSDFGNIQGYLIRTFDASGFLKIDEVDENYTKTIVEDEMMLNQIHNLVAVGSAPTVAYGGGASSTVPAAMQQYIGKAVMHGSVTGDPVSNVITYRPALYSRGFTGATTGGDDVLVGELGYSGEYLLNVFNPKFVENNAAAMEFTRLMSVWEKDTSDPTIKRAVALGTEFVNHIKIFWNTWNDTTKTIDTRDSRLPLVLVESINEGGAVEINYTAYDVINSLSKFHMAPRIPTAEYFKFGDDVTITFTGTTGDLMYWTTIDYSVLRDMHFNALQSVFSATLPVHVK